ncbi:50S ribosomal protein L20 [Candidatus Collierbacteria bacterium RIFCSPLOWO2_01_FULL_50_23]|uniref:Large ribosomal subunit protein bL20 n=2 Tax=Candidatus Collieribacteriota TaxID=1752725 RepID=A0A1F5ES87_9BACT|nr:MAG: 50S ribosomal protein L20 [Candidatus Collierbacteria bacterium RIFCSPHIGHO2_02_FULL_49_10]OGD71194.1 MAG: 50S ribosomal protein L20 [Candidatus Collierbacteria bacterium RIFCSPHIGHO2_01_FULL_50_25]OGD73775.1 MAG: 50S ribosomal protein L20 [Candidatus Collierbacteria bacterium RIFCSPLOWO2_01_FULL_50_23]
MPRVKTGVVRRTAHKKVLTANKGYRMTKRKLYKVAKEAYLHAGQYAYNSRRIKKRDFRTLWIGRITAALKLQENPVSYSKFIKAMGDKKVTLNRKSLSELAVKLPEVFSAVFKFTTSK